MKWLFITLCCCFSFSAFAQKTSEVYDAKGRLIADSSYSISKKQLIFFSKIEDTIIKQLLNNQAEYPEEAQDNYIQGKVFISFEINDSNSFCNFLLLNDGSPNFRTAYHFFLPSLTSAFLKVKLPNYKIPKDILYKKYYLNFEFHLSETLESRNYFSKGSFIFVRKQQPVEMIETFGSILTDSTGDKVDSIKH